MSNILAMQIRNSRRKMRIPLIELAAHLQMNQDYLVKIELGEIRHPQERVEHILSVIQNWRKAGPFDCDSKDYMEFKRIRRKCKMTIVELSEITGVSQGEIVSYERGMASLPEAKFQSLLRALEDPAGFSARKSLPQ